MSAQDDFVRRSEALEKIRSDLRKHLDKLARHARKNPMKRTFEISYDARLLLTPSEEKAMRRQIEASHGEYFAIKVEFKHKKKRRRPTVTSIAVHVVSRKARQLKL